MVVTCLVIVRFMFSVSTENTQHLCGQIDSYCDPGWFTQQQSRGDYLGHNFHQDQGRLVKSSGQQWHQKAKEKAIPDVLVWLIAVCSLRGVHIMLMKAGP